MSKSKKVHIEEELKRARDHENWALFNELARKFSENNPALNWLTSLLLAESAYETCDFDSAHNLLTQVLGEKPDCQEALWLMGKVTYQQQSYARALEYLQRVNQPPLVPSTQTSVSISQLSAPIPSLLRTVSIYLDSQTYQAQCHEALNRDALANLQSQSDVEAAREQLQRSLSIYRAIVEFGTSAYLKFFTTIPLTLQQSGTNSAVYNSEMRMFLAIVQNAMLQQPLLLKTDRQLDASLHAFRACFVPPPPFEFLPEFRFRILRELGRLLIHDICEADYIPPGAVTGSAAAQAMQDILRDPTVYVPQDLASEAILSLMLALAAAPQNPVLGNNFTPPKGVQLQSTTASGVSSSVSNAVLATSSSVHVISASQSAPNISQQQQQQQQQQQPTTAAAPVQSSVVSLVAQAFSPVEVASVYNDICILLTRYKHLAAIPELIEQGLGNFIRNEHLWCQFALSMMAANQYERALLAFKECLDINATTAGAENPAATAAASSPNAASVINAIMYLLFSAKISLNYLNNVHEALDYATEALQLCTSGCLLTSQVHHIIALAYSKLAENAQARAERDGFQVKALEAYHKAYQLEQRFGAPNPMLLFHLALQYAEIRELNQAFQYVRLSLSVEKRHSVDSWILLSLLFSAKKDLISAFKTVKAARLQNPNHLRLLLLHARMEEAFDNEKKAAALYKLVAERINKKLIAVDERLNIAAPSVAAVAPVTVPSDVTTASRQSQRSSLLPPQSHENNATTSQQKQMNTKQVRKMEKLIQCYLLVVEGYRRLEMYDDVQLTMRAIETVLLRAEPLVSQTCIRTLTPDTYYQWGMLFQQTDRLQEAINSFENALLLNSTHKHSLLQLADIYLQQHQNNKKQQTATAAAATTTADVSELNKLILARSYLQTAIRVDTTFAPAWSKLGGAMKELGQFDEASECFSAALKLEQTAPIIPFASTLLPKKI